MNEIVQIISTVGFPIVAVIGMGYFFFDIWTKQDVRTKEREDKMFELVRDLSSKLAEIGQIVDKNTEVLVVLTEKVAQLEEQIHKE